MSAEEDLPVDAARQDAKRKTLTVMEQTSDGLSEEKNHDRRQTSLMLGNGQAATSYINPNNNTMTSDNIRIMLQKILLEGLLDHCDSTY